MSRKTRKLMWSAPLAAVFAVVGALAIFAAVTPGGVFAHDAPGAATGVTATADGKTAVDLKWTAPTDGGTVEGYRIDLSSDGHSWMMLVANTGSTATSHRDTMDVRAGGSDRYYRVFAMNSVGTGPVSNTAGPVIAAAAGNPSDVKGLVVRATGQKSIELIWNAPEDDGGTPIENYLVYFAPTLTLLDALTAPPTTNEAVAVNSDGAGVAKTDDDTRRYVHEVASAGATMWFRVYAYNGATFSQGAAETRSSSSLPLTNPGAPTELIALQEIGNNRNVQLYWYWPADNGGRDVDGFKIERKGPTGGWVVLNVGSPGDTFPNGASLPVAGSSRDYQDTTPDADGTYQYRVSAITGFADGETGARVSDPSNVATIRVAEGVAVPGDCAADNLTPVQARTCTWDAAQVGDTELSASRDGKGNVEVRIMRNNPAAATSFRIDVSPDGIKWNPVQRSTGNLGDKNEPLIYEYLDETTGSELRYRVVASVGSIRVPANAAPQLVTRKPVNQPGQTTSLKAEAISPTQIDISWGAPTTDGGANVDMYCVVASADATFEEMAADENTDANDTDTAKALCAPTTPPGTEIYRLVDTMSYSHTKLTAEQTWYYRVFAINNPVYGGDERSANSDTVSETTDEVDKPAMPEGLVAEPAKDSNYGGRLNQGVLLLWNAPKDPAGGKIDGYRVERMVNGADWVTLSTDTAGTADDASDTRTVYHDTSEPAEGEMRGYRVAARSGSVIGEWSMTAYIPAPEHSHNADPMASGMIGDVMVTEGEMSTMDVTMYFSDADDDMLTYRAMSDDTSVADVSVDGSMVTITGVAAGMTTVKVYASDGMGGMDAMQTIDVTVTMELMAPSNVRANPVGSGLVNVGWDMVPGAAGYTIVAVNIADTSEVMTESVNNPDAVAGQIGNLTVGAQYNIYVGSFDAALDFAVDFSEKVRVTVE